MHLIGFFSHAYCIFNTEVARKIGFYCTDALSSDFDSAMRMLLEGNIIVSSRKVVHWRVHEHNESQYLNENKYAGELRTIKSIISAAEGKIPPAALKTVKRQLLSGLFAKILGIFEAEKTIKAD